MGNMNTGANDNSARPAGNQAAANQAAMSAMKLLAFEADVRQQSTRDDLLGHLLNQSRSVLDCNQVMLLRPSGRGWHVERVSDVRSVDSSSELVSTVQHLVKESWDLRGTDETRLEFTLEGDQKGVSEYPFPYGCLTCLGDAENPNTLLVLFLRETPFNGQQKALIERLSDVYGHALTAVSGRRHFGSGSSSRRWWRRGLLLFAIAVACIPVHLSVLAPVTVLPADGWQLKSPLNGVIRRMSVAPNETVKAGDLLLEFEDLELRSSASLARQERAIAKARAEQVNVEAFSSQDAAYLLPIRQAEYLLAEEKARYTEAKFKQARIYAPMDGMVMYSSRRDWEGKSVMVGEEILQVATGKKIRFAIDLPTSSAVQVSTGQSVRVLLNDSLNGGLPAKLTVISYSPVVSDAGGMVYRLMAELDQSLLQADAPLPRLGSQGTAHLTGERVPLIYQLVRHPLQLLRQQIGW